MGSISFMAAPVVPTIQTPKERIDALEQALHEAYHRIRQLERELSEARSSSSYQSEQINHFHEVERLRCGRWGL